MTPILTGLPTPRTSTRTTRARPTPHQAWAVLASGGPGEHWYADAAPLRFRAALDRAVGGPGAPWTPPPRELAAGDRAGFWRVVAAVPPTATGPSTTARGTLVLEAQVRAPGRVTLTVEVAASGTGSAITTTVRLDPRGVLGAAYLVVDLPAREVLTELVHRRMLAEVEDRA